MARLARVIATGAPHHVTQRGNRRQDVFFTADDYRLYKALLAEQCARFRVAVWAYCLMPNHVHLMLVPRDERGLAAAVGEAHRRYSRHVNSRENWRGFLFQGRFGSCPMDNAYTLACARYIELNPVRAGLRRTARDWPWSSARAHLAGASDDLVDVKPLLAEVSDWRGFLGEDVADADLAALRLAARTGRPLGEERFVAGLERKLGRALKRGKPGPKPAAGDVRLARRGARHVR
jgi:putative transposase